MNGTGAGQAHLSALAIARLLLRGATDLQWEEAETHAASCEPCRRELAAAREARERHQAHAGARVARKLGMRRRAHVDRRRGAAWIGAAMAGVAMAAVVLIVLVPRDGQKRQVVAVKGAPSVQLFARRGTAVFQVREGQALAAGDAVRFAVSPAGATQVLIASVDGAGRATVYHPYGGGASAPLPAAPTVEIPQSIILDDAPGPERIFVFVSNREIPADPVVGGLRRLGELGQGAIRDTAILALDIPDVMQTSFLIEKGTVP